MLQQLEEQRREKLAQIDRHVTESGFKLLKSPGGLMLAPALGDKLLSDGDLERLTGPEREKIARARDRLQHEIEERLRSVRELEKGIRDALRALDTDTAVYATRHVMEDLLARYHDLPTVLDYLAALQADITAHADEFRKGKEQETPAVLAPLMQGTEKPLVRYQVNVLVNNSGLKGAPVVVETNPTYHNLIGRIERQATWSGVVTDHTMIKPGALHRANGGYLIVPARECLMNPCAWDGLKRALKDCALRIEELGTQLSLVSTVTLDPEPVPLDVKVVLIGSPALYYLLNAYDEDFQKLFKVKADFMTLDEESERAYGRFVNNIAQQGKTLSFDSLAVARIIEYGSRAVDDQDHLSTRFGDIADLVREGAHLAGRNSHTAVTARDVHAAEEARWFRQNLLEERLQEAPLKGTLLVETSDRSVGRINGLSVLSLGDFSLGHPARLTATVAPGRDVVSIEREVELSGPIHGKGVLILSGYLLRKYGQAGPLSVSASLVFEQSYNLVEGDSASLAELCVFLSASSDTPLRQDIAVTGSVNQHGQMQPVGGVIQKIEGFFYLCLARGLTGSQGVLRPAANRRHLMLRDDVVEAASASLSRIWIASEVDEALELHTGRPVCQTLRESIRKAASSGRWPAA